MNKIIQICIYEFIYLYIGMYNKINNSSTLDEKTF